MTIPRLELMGAVLATRLSTNIVKTLNLNGATYWTDSTNVLYWIRNQSRIFKPFVANRVAEIQRESNPNQWRHIPGEINPADLPTRGLSASELCQSKSWMRGPDFLINDEKTWPERLPNNLPLDAAVKEEKNVETHATNETDKTTRLDPSRYSSWTRLVRVTAWIKRFTLNCRAPPELGDMSYVLRNTELSDAQTFWLGKAELEGFPGKEKDKRLLRFSPFLDKDGLLRVDGRLRLAKDLPYDTRHPVILPKKHPVTRLVIIDAHEKLGHRMGAEHLLTELRSRFWIVKGRLMVRTEVESCPACRRRFLAKPVGQKMAPLPMSRLTLLLRAFERIGTDFAGPFFTKQGRGKSRMKRYLCLFTCLATHAVHLEIAYSLDDSTEGDAFLCVIR